VSAYGEFVNHINIMAYDINGSLGAFTDVSDPLVGRNELTYAGGAQAWIDAGFLPKQIIMGIPF
jgi:hypothetical protein